MQFRLYLLDVSELEDNNLQQKALSLMDSFRKGKVYKYKTLKDRLHQIATGLLLQVGLLELEIAGAIQIEYGCDASKDDVSGSVFICQARDVISSLGTYANQGNDISIPIEAQYDVKECGKLYWESEFLRYFSTKQFMEFSISHSGAYAALAISDYEIGLDIQQKRETKFVGGCQEFSRMEAFVKCTGDGYAKGFKKYKSLEKNTTDFIFSKINVLSDYVIYLCHYKEEVKRGVYEEKIADN